MFRKLYYILNFSFSWNILFSPEFPLHRKNNDYKKFHYGSERVSISQKRYSHHVHPFDLKKYQIQNIYQY